MQMAAYGCAGTWLGHKVWVTDLVEDMVLNGLVPYGRLDHA